LQSAIITVCKQKPITLATTLPSGDDDGDEEAAPTGSIRGLVWHDDVRRASDGIQQDDEDKLAG
jgi:hypothetical protein